MSIGPSGRSEPFRAAYAHALVEYLSTGAESSLRVAYELGRDAVRRRLSVLDVADAHQEALAAALALAPDAERVQETTRGAGDFLLESLASFEMVQRGLTEARRAVVGERRRTELARRLSTFLADASLALDTSGSLDEMLRLVAEQARELVDADCCLVTLGAAGRPRLAEAVSHAGEERRWAPLVRWLDLPAVYGLLRQNGGLARSAGEALADLAPFRTRTQAHPVRAWLAASLTALDGRELGAVQLFDEASGAFTPDDGAALVHLAQMASAAVERAQLYRERGR